MASRRIWCSRLLLASALMVPGTMGCGPGVIAGEDPPPPPSVTPPVPPTVAAATVAPPSTASSGSPFTAPDGRFTAQFPSPPGRAERSGGGVTYVFYGTERNGQPHISVGFLDNPKSVDLRDPSAALRREAAQEGTLSTKDTTFLGRPALDIVVRRVEEGVTLYLHERSFLAGSRMYFLHGRSATTTAPPEHATLLVTFKLTG